jgi:hypothetical protein
MLRASRRALSGSSLRMIRGGLLMLVISSTALSGQSDNAGQGLERVVHVSVLLISGVAYRDGRLELSGMSMLPEGIIDPGASGPISLQVLDGRGRVLHTTFFAVTFKKLTHPAVEVDSVPFGFAVPYPDEAVRVRLLRDSREQERIIIASRLLRDAVSAVSDDSFETSAHEKKQALLAKIAAFAQALENGEVTRARATAGEIREDVESWPKVNRLESNHGFGKTRVLQLIDEVLRRISPPRSVRGTNRGLATVPDFPFSK